MSLRDYDVPNDHFEPDHGAGGPWCFPCSACAYRVRHQADEPCRTCGHNANAQPTEETP